MLVLALAALAGGFLAFGAARWLEAACPAALRDRSATARGKPRVGGLAIAAALLPIALVTGDGALLAPVLLATLLGAHDDATDSPAVLRLLALAAIAVLAAVLVPGPLPWPAAAALVLCTVVGFDFIDGLDGLACGLALLGLAPLAAFGSPFAAAAAGAVGAYLLASNRPPARSLLGDAGSNGLGVALGVALLSAARDHASTPPVLLLSALAALAAVPLLDLLTTVLRRARSGALFASETEHLHHRLARRGGKAALVELALAAAVCAGAGATVLFGGSWAALTLAPVACGWLVLRARRA